MDLLVPRRESVRIHALDPRQEATMGSEKRRDPEDQERKELPPDTEEHKESDPDDERELRRLEREKAEENDSTSS